MRTALLLLLTATAGCVTPPSPLVDPPGGPLPPMLATVVDDDLEGFEPSLHITRDGAIFICSPRGVGAGTDLWRSVDGGASFDYVGSIIEPTGNAVRSRTADNAGGDCDLGEDAGGRIYLVDLWAASVSVAWTDDGGDTWAGVPLSHVPHLVDRPWVLGGAAGEVFITSGEGVATTDADDPTDPLHRKTVGLWVIRSTDGGRTFPQQVLLAADDRRLGHNSNLATDGENLYLLYGWQADRDKMEMRVGISGDRGITWTHSTASTHTIDPDQCFSPFRIFPVVAADPNGGIYAVWTLNNVTAGRIELYYQSSPDRGATWNPPVRLLDRESSPRYPWATVDRNGTLYVAWYEAPVASYAENRGDLPSPFEDACAESNEDIDSATWHLHYARIEGAATHTPTIREGLVQEAPIHRGYLGRPYAEVLQIELLADGRAAVAYVADVPEGKARPMFAVEGGPAAGTPEAARGGGAVDEAAARLARLLGHRVAR